MLRSVVSKWYHFSLIMQIISFSLPIIKSLSCFCLMILDLYIINKSLKNDKRRFAAIIWS